MIDVENDEIIERLADFVGVDLSNLEILDEYERKEIELAHEIRGLAYDDIAHFLSKAEIPEFISPNWIFKALKYNDDFYFQNISLIRATQWMREEIYEKAKNVSKTQKSELKENQISNNIIQRSKKELRQYHKKQPDNTYFSKSSMKKIVIPPKNKVNAAATDDNYKLPDCYKRPEDADYEICPGNVFPSPENPDYKEICIQLKPNNMKQFISNERSFYICFFTEDETVYTIGPVIPKKTDDDNIVEICALFNPKDLSLLGKAWGLSYTEDIDFYF